MKKAQKTKQALLGWAFLSALALLLICSKSSPLYPTNDWVDVQCFFTVGRGILQGKMPYLDLYEQKGPILYLFFALTALISSENFLGVFILEVICLGLFLYISTRIAALWVRDVSWPLFLLPPVLALSIGVSPAFSHGSSAEELFLPVIALFLKLALTAIHEDRALSKGEAFLCGVLAALALWVKYTFCGIFAGGVLALLVWYIATKKASQLWVAVLYGLLGVLALTVPVLLWFWAKGALSSLWQVYFVNNLTAYAAGKSPRHEPPLTALLNNGMWSIPAAVGCLWPLLRPKKYWGHGLLLVLSAAALGLFTYANGRTYPYYALVLAAFCALGWIPVLLFLQWAFHKAPQGAVRLSAALLSILLLGGSIFAAYKRSSNVYLMAYEKEDLPQYRFAEIIQQDEDASLLNLGFLDGGFYLASGVEPQNRFFCTFNLSLDEQDQEHSELIQTGSVKYIVVRGKKSPGRNYTLVDQCAFPFEGRTWTYSLYKLSDGTVNESSRKSSGKKGINTLFLKP